jgi:GntR family transcriptional regulator, transcriptional repressor for pyruvate dehydrogenase complex
VALTDEAIDKIKRMITSGELGPGDRLPREADLAERLGLSRNSLREAVRALSMINVLDVRQGDGTYVTSLDPALLLDALSFVVDFHRDDTVLQFLEVRRILEPAATALAAERMPDADIEELRHLLDALDPTPTVEALIANDLEFHRRIAAGAGNPVLCSLIDGLSAPTTRARIWRGLTQEGAVTKTREQHEAIHNAIAARRPDLAQSWATIHIAGVEEWLRQAA